jgi:hypothetical protein
VAGLATKNVGHTLRAAMASAARDGLASLTGGMRAAMILRWLVSPHVRCFQVPRSAGLATALPRTQHHHVAIVDSAPCIQSKPDLPVCSSCGAASARFVPVWLPSSSQPGLAFCEVCAAYDGVPPVQVLYDSRQSLELPEIAPVVSAQSSSASAASATSQHTDSTSAAAEAATESHPKAREHLPPRAAPTDIHSKATGDAPCGVFMDVTSLALWSARMADVFFDSEFECRAARFEGRDVVCCGSHAMHQCWGITAPRCLAVSGWPQSLTQTTKANQVHVFGD